MNPRTPENRDSALIDAAINIAPAVVGAGFGCLKPLIPAFFIICGTGTFFAFGGGNWIQQTLDKVGTGLNNAANAPIALKRGLNEVDADATATAQAQDIRHNFAQENFRAFKESNWVNQNATRTAAGLPLIPDPQAATPSPEEENKQQTKEIINQISESFLGSDLQTGAEEINGNCGTGLIRAEVAYLFGDQDTLVPEFTIVLDNKRRKLTPDQTQDLIEKGQVYEFTNGTWANEKTGVTSEAVTIVCLGAPQNQGLQP